jgi:hypothetical protein
VKNITVSVPDDVYRDARVHAAERESSVSALVAEYLRSLSDRNAARARMREKRRQILERVPAGFSGSDRLSRDELYERALRRH